MTVILNRSALTDALVLAAPASGAGRDTVLPAPGDPWAAAAESSAPRLRAWALALAIHGLAAALLLETPGPMPPADTPPLVRLVFVEPPPPPPAGAPAAGSAEVPAPAATNPPAEPTRTPAVARAKAPARRAAARPTPARRPAAPVAADPAPTPTAQSPSGEPTEAAAGSPDGVPGGVVGGRGSAPVPVGQVAQPPQVLSRVPPDYPDAARRRGIEGLVLLEAVLDAEGRVAPDVAILRSVPDLDAAAVAALRRWRFRPARDDSGRAVPVILEVPIRFVLR